MISKINSSGRCTGSLSLRELVVLFVGEDAAFELESEAQDGDRLQVSSLFSIYNMNTRCSGTTCPLMVRCREWRRSLKWEESLVKSSRVIISVCCMK